MEWHLLDIADIGVGGSVAPCNRCAVWRYVIAFRRSPFASSSINCNTCESAHATLIQAF